MESNGICTQCVLECILKVNLSFNFQDLQSDFLNLILLDSQLLVSCWHCCHLVAKSCLTLCDPMDCSLPGSFCPWDFPGNSTGAGCHFLFRGSSWPRDRTDISCLRQAGSLLLRHQGSPLVSWNPIRVRVFLVLFFPLLLWRAHTAC